MAAPPPCEHWGHLSYHRVTLFSVSRSPGSGGLHTAVQNLGLWGSSLCFPREGPSLCEPGPPAPQSWEPQEEAQLPAWLSGRDDECAPSAPSPEFPDPAAPQGQPWFHGHATPEDGAPSSQGIPSNLIPQLRRGSPTLWQVPSLGTVCMWQDQGAP